MRCPSGRSGTARYRASRISSTYGRFLAREQVAGALSKACPCADSPNVLAYLGNVIAAQAVILLRPPACCLIFRANSHACAQPCAGKPVMPRAVVLVASVRILRACSRCTCIAAWPGGSAAVCTALPVDGSAGRRRGAWQVACQCCAPPARHVCLCFLHAIPDCLIS